ncbi:DUF4013 domain-containing protein [Natrinema altunense]|uniref:DUF4013 domain-containing protein n=1 Tax=Natrinema altunense (strain JCM 12890 / CGMCC 1.3731 / AJ2) TaxID=1227494 RepID=L9ZJU9_NATA2|nr:DUF4013 domain-containing protein [Natrinema altunense]ELY85857.1 hypothetical protein C485_11668 [Natrinema altunense JCM 12890]
MSYCHDCDEEFEPGTILCPECGAKLSGSDDDTGTASGWSTDDSGSDDTVGWSSTDSASTDTSGWSTDTPTTDETSGWSTDDSARDDTSGWSSTDSTRDDSGWGSGDTAETSGAATAHREPGPAGASEPRSHDRDIFEFSFAFPLGKGGKPLLIDSVLLLLSFLLVPLLFSYGYSYRVGRAAARGDGDVPSFDDWGGLGTDGLILVGVYLGVALAFSVLVAAFIGAIAVVGESSALVLVLLAIGTLLVFACVYVAGAIVPVLIGTGSLTETFSNGRLLEFALSRHYLKGVVLLFVFWFVLSIAASIVAVVLAITVLGIVLLIPLYFVFTAYTANLAFAMWGYIYNEAAAAGDVEPVAPDASLGLR